MTALNDKYELIVLDYLLNQTSPTAITPIYAALFTDAAADSDMETAVPTYTNEVANANGYARVVVTTKFDAASGTAGTLSNNASIDFAAASGGNWGTIKYVAITNSATRGAGDVLLWAQLSANKTVNDGDTFSFPTGDLTLTVA